MANTIVQTRDGILSSIKKMLGGAGNEDTSFDVDIIIHINSVLSILNQMGIGVADFSISGYDETWSDFLGESTTAGITEKFQMVVSYVYFKVRMMFDPPSNSTILKSFEEQIKELEFRLYSKANFTNN